MHASLTLRSVKVQAPLDVTRGSSRSSEVDIDLSNTSANSSSGSGIINLGIVINITCTITLPSWLYFKKRPLPTILPLFDIVTLSLQVDTQIQVSGIIVITYPLHRFTAELVEGITGAGRELHK